MGPPKILSRQNPNGQDHATAGLVGSAVRWFLGLSALYILYAASAAFSVNDGLRVADRIGAIVGPTTAALSLLVAPATFAATIGNPPPPGTCGPRVVGRYAAKLVLLGLCAFGMCAFGPWFSSVFLPTELYSLSDLAPASRQVLESARVMVPTTIAVFAVLSGVAGALIGRVTVWWNSRRRTLKTWLSWLTLFLSFWVPFLLAANLILRGVIPVVWILVGPLLFPSLLVVVFAFVVFADLRRTVSLVGRLVKFSSHDPPDLDRVDHAVNPRDDAERAGFLGVTDATRSEQEMIQMAKGIRQVVAGDANLSPQRLDEITKVLLDASASKKTTVVRRGRRRTDQLVWVGGLLAVWTCFASGVLMVGMLGGAPPDLGLAGLVGLLGSAVILTVTEALPELVR